MRNESHHVLYITDCRLQEYLSTNTELTDQLTKLQEAVESKQQQLSQLTRKQRDAATHAAKRITSAGQLGRARQENTKLKHR